MASRTEKGIAAEAQILVPFALGIRENTRMTVTVREVLFSVFLVFRNSIRLLYDGCPRLLFL